MLGEMCIRDSDEIWWLETIGGHHWMAVKVPDDHYVAMPNQLGIDHFDLEECSVSYSGLLSFFTLQK